MQCFENFGGANAPNPSPWLRAWAMAYRGFKHYIFKFGDSSFFVVRPRPAEIMDSWNYCSFAPQSKLFFCDSVLSRKDGLFLLVKLSQGCPTCGTRTTSGMWRSYKWYMSNFQFFTKIWIHSFLVYVSGFVSKSINFLVACYSYCIVTI